jgi:hypothetical protein
MRTEGLGCNARSAIRMPISSETHRACRDDHAGRVIERIRHIHVARTVRREAVGVNELSGRPGAVGRAGQAGGARKRANQARGGHLADDIVERIRNIDVARGVGRESARGIEQCRAPGAVG